MRMKYLLKWYSIISITNITVIILAIGLWWVGKGFSIQGSLRKGLVQDRRWYKRVYLFNAPLYE